MSFKQDLRKRLFIILPIIGLALVAGCTTDPREADGFFEHVGVMITQCFTCIILLVIIGAFVYFLKKLISYDRGIKKVVDEHLTKLFLKHGIQKSDFPAIICHCHSCSKIFIVTQKCSKCGTSAGSFLKEGTGFGTAQRFSCGCGWGHDTATCSCGTENSAVRMGQYVIVLKGISHRSGIEVF